MKPLWWKRRSLWLGSALFLPLAYILLENAYYLLLDHGIYVIWPELQQYFQTRPDGEDGLFCLLLLLVLYPISRKIKGIVTSASPSCRRPRKISGQDLWKLVVITFAIGGLSTLWLGFADQYLRELPFFSQSLMDFESAFEPAVTSQAYLWSLISIVFAGPLVEELIFRQPLIDVLETKISPASAIFLSALLFGLWHYIAVQVVYTFVMGLVLAAIYELWDKNLLAPLFVHVLNNFTATLPPGMDTDQTLIFLYVLEMGCLLPGAWLLWKEWKNHKTFSEKHWPDSMES